MKEADVRDGVRRPGRRRDLLPGLVGWDEAVGRGGTGVDDPVAVEAAEPPLSAVSGIADGLHRPCPVRSTLSALIARGMPV